MNATAHDWRKGSRMQTPTDSASHSCSARFGNRAVDPDMVRFVVGASLALLFLLLAILRPPVDLLLGNLSRNHALQVVRVKDSDSLVEHLKSYDLWEVYPGNVIPPVVFTHFPDDLNRLGLPEKKRAFLHTLLPVAMVANAEVAQERTALLALLEKLGDRDPDPLLTKKDDGGDCPLNKAELYFLQQLSEKYHTRRMSELLRRVDVVPVSLMLAQGALESSWGGSRFASEGNNLFGVWTWGTTGMVPLGRNAGERHLVAMYDSILDSARSYLLMINRQAAYRDLRLLRERSMNSLVLANGLLRYSERREDYVVELQAFIHQNRLQRYDDCVLSAGISSQGSRLFRLASLAE